MLSFATPAPWRVPGTADGSVTLVAYVSARDGAPAGLLQELKQQMRSLPAPMRPARFYVAEQIPRLPSSKLDLRALVALDEVTVQKELANVAAAVQGNPAGSNGITERVSRVWQEVLQAPVCSPDDDFFRIRRRFAKSNNLYDGSSNAPSASSYH
jgi:hypothetical protein